MSPRRSAAKHEEPAHDGLFVLRVPVRQGFATVIDEVPPKVELPPTVLTVNLTEPVRLGMPDFETVHWPLELVVHDAVPDAPLLHVPETSTLPAAEPFEVTEIVTFAVQDDPLLTLKPLRDTLVPVVEPLGVAEVWFEFVDSLLDVSTALTT